MGVFAKKFKAEIGAAISFIISTVLVLASKESWSPIAPVIGLLISLSICKLLISKSIKAEKENINSQSDSAQADMLNALKIISENQGNGADSNAFSKLASKLEDNLIQLYDNKMKSIEDSIDKVKKLESENEEVDNEILSSVRKAMNNQDG